MKKFFLFRRSVETATSSSISNSGVGVSTIAIPADLMCFVATATGSVTITFNDATAFQQTLLVEGESLKKTNVTVSCEVGRETSLVESILEFISKDSKKSVMRFDVVSGTSTFAQAVVDSVADLAPQIPTVPVVTATGADSDGGQEAAYNNTIGGINFGSEANLPFIDYNETNLPSSVSAPSDSDSSGDAGFEIFTGGSFAWKNAGTGGATYNITESRSVNNVSTVTVSTTQTRAGSGCATDSAAFTTSNFLVVPSVSFDKDYTMYMVFCQVESFIQTFSLFFQFGSETGQTFGLGKVDIPRTRLHIRHEGVTGEPAFISLSDPRGVSDPNLLVPSEQGYSIPNLDRTGDSSKDQVCYPIVIRRDPALNIVFYNFEGEIIGVIPSSSTSPSDPNQTGGELLIERIGATSQVDDLADGLTLSDANNRNSLSFRGFLPRFGVINRDIGNDSCVSLAQQLFAKYNPTS